MLDPGGDARVQPRHEPLGGFAGAHAAKWLMSQSMRRRPDVKCGAEGHVSTCCWKRGSRAAWPRRACGGRQYGCVKR